MRPVSPTPRRFRDLAPDGHVGHEPIEGTVLVVDDDESVSDMVVRVLQRFGMEALVARDGDECLECFRRNCKAIDMVLLDLTIPGMSGATLIAELRRIRREVPVLLSSGFSEDEVRSQLGDDLPDGILRKPYRLSALHNKVLAMLKHGSDAPASVAAPAHDPKLS